MGIVGLADDRAHAKHDLWSAFYLLDYVEKHVGTGIALAEVWFGIFGFAIVHIDLPTARTAHDQCLPAQADYIMFWITPAQLRSVFENTIWDRTMTFDAFLELERGRPRPFPDQAGVQDHATRGA